MLIVDDDLRIARTRNSTSIQAAATAAPAGSKIKVCPARYVEQVTIPAGKDGLTLFSEGDLQAVIKAPPIMIPNPSKSIVLIQAQDVTLRHFTITGPGGGPCDTSSTASVSTRAARHW